MVKCGMLFDMRDHFNIIVSVSMLVCRDDGCLSRVALGCVVVLLHCGRIMIFVQ
jgi:hypothetical protein